MYQVQRTWFLLCWPVAIFAGVIIGGIYNAGEQQQYFSPQVAFVTPEDSNSKDTIIPSIYGHSLTHGMDTSVSPCDDFYEYVNGGWRKEVTFPSRTHASRMSWNNFADSPRRTYAKLTELMEEVRQSYSTSSDPIVRLVGTFYQSCLVSDSLEISIAALSRTRKPTKDSSRVDMCISRARRYLGGAVGEMFAHKLDEAGSIEKMRDMLSSIKSEVGVLISTNKLMTDADRKGALDRLEKLYLRVGMPDERTDYSGLELSPTDYFKNKDAIANFNTVRSANFIGGDTRERWKMSSFTANAFYSSIEHAIEVPPAMFIPPFFEPEQDDALSYAASGVIIGHEIFHSLTGQIAVSQNPETQAEIDSFKAINSRLGTVDGWNTDGKRTYSEDIADLGGVKASYGAWKKNLNKDEAKRDAAIEGFTPDQRFFIAYGRLWRGKWTPSTAGNNGVHAALFARINGIVRQMPEFATAFGCTEGDKMVLPASQRSNLW